MADPIEDLERAVAGLKAQRDRQTAGINEVAGEIPKVERLVTEVLAERDQALKRLHSVREAVDGFLSEYGDSEIPMFKVAQDLASAIRKRLDGELDDV